MEQMHVGIFIQKLKQMPRHLPTASRVLVMWLMGIASLSASSGGLSLLCPRVQQDRHVRGLMMGRSCCRNTTAASHLRETA